MIHFIKSNSDVHSVKSIILAYHPHNSSHPFLPVNMINTLLEKQKHGVHIVLFLNGPQLLKSGLIMMHDTLSS